MPTKTPDRLRPAPDHLPVPQQEAENRDHGDIDDARDHVLAAIVRALDQQEDSCDHVDDQRDDQ